MQFILATNNKNKVKEIKTIFSGVEIISLSEAGIDVDIEETGNTFEENALIKARAIYEMTGKPSLGDDSGLTVEALGNRPGIFSARYAGVHGDTEANNIKLLREMEGVTNRNAEYVCAVAFVCDKGEFSAVGKAKGEILRSGRGLGGFGYDPLFYSPELNMTFAEAPLELKNGVSHRARALNKLKNLLIQNNIL